MAASVWWTVELGPVPLSDATKAAVNTGRTSPEPVMSLLQDAACQGRARVRISRLVRVEYRGLSYITMDLQCHTGASPMHGSPMPNLRVTGAHHLNQWISCDYHWSDRTLPITWILQRRCSRSYSYPRQALTPAAKKVRSQTLAAPLRL